MFKCFSRHSYESEKHRLYLLTNIWAKTQLFHIWRQSTYEHTALKTQRYRAEIISQLEWKYFIILTTNIFILEQTLHQPCKCTCVLFFINWGYNESPRSTEHFTRNTLMELSKKNDHPCRSQKGSVKAIDIALEVLNNFLIRKIIK